MSWEVSGEVPYKASLPFHSSLNVSAWGSGTARSLFSLLVCYAWKQGGEIFLPHFPPLGDRDIAAVDSLIRAENLFVESARARLVSEGIPIGEEEEKTVREACSILWEEWDLSQLRTNRRAILNPNSGIFEEFLRNFHELNGP